MGEPPGLDGSIASNNLSAILPEDVHRATEAFVGREWLLETVDSWLNGGGKSRFLALVAPSGVGKTVLSAWLLGVGPEPASEPDAALLRQIRGAWNGAYFCSRRHLYCSIDPYDFSRSMSKQLLTVGVSLATLLLGREPPTVIGTAQATVNSGGLSGVTIGRLEVAGAHAYETFVALVRDPLVAHLAERPMDRIALLVDGLDEASAFPSPNIIDLVANGLGSLPENARVLLSLKDDRSLLRRLARSLPDMTLLDLGEDSKRPAALADVRAYLQRELPKMDNLQLDGFAELASDNFLIASSLVDDYRQGRTPSSSSMPGSVGDRYLEICDYLSGDGPEEFAWLNKHVRLLGILAVAFEAVPQATLCIWLGVDRLRLRQLLEGIDVLIDIDRLSGAVRYRHGYLQLFFLRESVEGSGRSNPYALDEADQHAIVLEAYLGLDPLSFDPYGAMHFASHLRAYLGCAPTGRFRGPGLERLAEVISSPTFRSRLRFLVEEPLERARLFRVGLPLLLETGHHDAAAETLRSLSGDPVL